MFWGGGDGQGLVLVGFGQEVERQGPFRSEGRATRAPEAKNRSKGTAIRADVEYFRPGGRAIRAPNGAESAQPSGLRGPNGCRRAKKGKLKRLRASNTPIAPP